MEGKRLDYLALGAGRPLPPPPPAKVTLDISKEQLEGMFNTLYSALVKEMQSCSAPGRHNGPKALQFSTNVVDEATRSALVTSKADGDTGLGEPTYLVRAMQELEEGKSLLIAEKNSMVEELTMLRAEVSRLQQTEQRLLEKDAQIKVLQDKSARLGQIIISSGKDDTDIPDHAVWQLFTDVRDSIQRIVHRHYETKAIRKLSKHVLGNYANKHFEKQKRLKQDIAGYDSETLQLLYIRASIFRTVLDRIMDEKTFGVSTKLENNFGDFEAALDELPERDPASVAEWRSRTIECGERLKGRSRLSKDIGHDLLDLYEPYQKTDLTSTQLTEGMMDLCEKAYNLSVLMRKSRRANWAITEPKVGSRYTSEGPLPMSCLDFRGPQPSDIEGTAVDMVIFGNLTKYPQDAPGRVSLEAAQVVCRPWSAS